MPRQDKSGKGRKVNAMGKKGLCVTCEEVKSCIFSKEPPVLQCEEFSLGAVEIKVIPPQANKRVIRAETTEGE
ncbi:MAG: hypothetical protein PHN59_01075 [Candidatus Omnitrophica bacterium]|nr:hypothetical protein [Candidatus Omnitrophota bacterium]